MPKRKRSELKQLSAELAKRSRMRKSNNNNNKTAPGTRQSVPLRKCPNLNRAVDKEDPFSRLSDDIIVSHMLTRLSLREAMRTSALSRRWRNLWTASIGSKLIFSYPAKDIFMKSSRIRPILARGISRILEFAKPTLDELTVRFNFNSTSTYQAINRWVQIALTNKVTRLHLDFSSSSFDISPNNYTFPAIHSDSVKYPEIHNLRDVCFKFINVSGEVIECMLSNCPSLERLTVWGSSCLQKVRVCTQSAKLKSLEFVHCRYERIEISSPNLIYLGYSGIDGVLQIDYVPLLSELFIGSAYCNSFLQNGAQDFVKYISQLKRLKLDIKSWMIEQTISYLLEFPQLIKLEQLEIKLGPYWWTCHLWPIMLIKAAPSLQKFSIKLNGEELSRPYHDPDEDDHHKNLLNVVGQVRHPCLKLIEMLKFSGLSSEMELGQHLVSISPSLEQIVINRYYIGSRKDPRAFSNSPVPVEEYRMQAQKFKRWLPPTAKLVIQ